nr:hypothetical protein [uncultured Actinoplanes sp.]
MFRFPRRPAPDAGVRFCDGCAEVSTPAERARRHRDRTIARAHTLLGPR